MQKHGGIEINMSLTRELNREGVIRRTKYKREREREHRKDLPELLGHDRGAF